MSDLTMAQLKIAKYEAMVDANGFDTAFIDNSVHISNVSDSPSFGVAGAGDDFIWSETTSGGDVFGFGGNDIFVGTSRVAETFHGGSGTDTVAYVNATESVRVALPDDGSFISVVQGGAATGDVFDSIENVVGTQYSDTISGNGQNNQLFGGD